MKRQINFMILVILILRINSEEAQEVIENKQTEIQIKQNEMKVYKFKAQSSIENEMQIMAQQINNKHGFVEFEIYLSSQTFKPDQIENQKTCKNLHLLEPCIYNTEKQQKDVYFSIKCMKNCWFYIQIVYKDTIIIDESRENLIQVGRQKNSLELKMPLAKKEDYDYLILDIELKKVESSFINEKQLMSVIFPDQTKVKDQFISQIRVIYIINRQDNTFCEKCFMTIEVMVKLGSILSIHQYRRFNHIQIIPPNSYFLDYIDSQKKVFRLSNQMKDLHLYLNVINGPANDLYLNPNYLPYSLDKFQWHSTNSSSHFSSIFVPQLQLTSIQFTTTSYLYAAVISKAQGFFVLYPQLQQPDQTNALQIQIGQSVVRSIYKSDLQNMQMQLYQNNNNLNSQLLLIQLGLQKGRVDLYIRKCESSNNECKEISDEEIQRNINIDKKFLQISGQQSIELSSNCNKQGHVYCIFILCIRNNNNDETSQYFLSVNYKGGVLILDEDRAVELRMDSGQTELVKYSLKKRGMEEFKLMLSSENVIMKVYFGNKCIKNNLEVSEGNCEAIQGDNLNPVIIDTNKINLYDDYYIELIALMATNVRLELEVRRFNFNDNHNAPVQQHILYEGQSYNYVFTPTLNKLFFLINVDLQKLQEIYVQLSNIHDNLINIKAKQASPVTSIDYDWQSQSNLLTISQATNPTQFKLKTTYYIQVHYQAIIKQNIPFSIKYFHKSTIQHIIFNHLYSFSLLPNHTIRYAINLEFNDKNTITIMTAIVNNKLAKPLNVSISNSPFNSTFRFELKSQLEQIISYNQNQNWMDSIISQEIINKLCESQLEQKCIIYLKIQNPNIMEVNGIVQYKREISSNLLIQGQKQYFTLTESNPLKIYLIPKDTSYNIDIIVKSIYHVKFSATVQISRANIINQDQKKMKTQYLDQHIIQISKTWFAACEPDCRIAIWLDYQNSNDEREVKLTKYVSNVEIICLQPVTDLEAGQNQIFTLNSEEGKFFRIDISRYKEDDQEKGIQVDLHRHFGNGYMVYSIYNDENIELPQLNSWNTRNYMQVHDVSFVLTKSEIDKQWHSKSFLKLYLLVGVYQYSDYYYLKSSQTQTNNGMFTISYKMHQQSITDLYYNTLHNVNISTTHYYSISSTFNFTSLKLHFIKSSGTQYMIFYQICKNDITLIDCQSQLDQQNKNYKFNTTNKSLFEREIVNDLQEQNVRIMIGIFTYNNIQGQLYINKEDDIINLIEGYQMIEQREKGQKKVYKIYQTNQDQLLDLKINVYKGEVKVWVSDQEYSQISENHNTINASGNILNQESAIELFLKEKTKKDVWWYQMFFPLYVNVYSSQNSYYSIGYSNSFMNLQVLNVNHLFKDSIDPHFNKTHNVLLSQLTNLDDLYINIHTLNEVNINTLDIVMHAVHQTFLNQRHQFFDYALDIAVPNFPHLRGDNYLQIKVNTTSIKKKNMLEIYIKNNNNIKVQYQIIVENKNELLIGQDSQLIIQKNSKYIMQIGNEGILAVQLLNCKDNMVLIQDQKKHLENQYSTQQDIQLINSKEGELHLAVESENDKGQVLSHLKTKFYTQEEFQKILGIIMVDDLYDLQIEAINRHEAKVMIDFQPIYCQDCHDLISKSNKKDYNVIYKLAVSNNKDYLHQRTKCSSINESFFYQESILSEQQIRDFHDGRILAQDNNNEDNKYLIIPLLDDVQYYFVIIAELNNFPNQYKNKYFYSQQEFARPKWHHRFIFRIFFFFVIILIIVLTVLLYYKFKQNYLLKQRLNYEVSDVRNLSIVDKVVGLDSNDNVQMVEIQGYDKIVEDKL